MIRRAPRFIQTHSSGTVDERAAAIAALQAEPASASPKYFYDRLGSHLFDAITELDEYYPTRTEAAIFAVHGSEMAQRIGGGCSLVDLGAGNCEKAARLIPLLDPARYVAVDISADYLHDALKRLQREQPTLEIVGIGMDFSRSPNLPAGVIDGAGARPVFFYPGSSIGNFTPEEAVRFLSGLRAQAAGGGLLIGVDLVKPVPVLEAAYDDALGVTAAFNRNVLLHLNRRFGLDFALDGYVHRGFYNADAGRIEMHLESLHDQSVLLGDGQRRAFARGERIHTENSYKYHAAEFEALLGRAGFSQVRHWKSGEGGYFVFYAT